MTTKNGNGSQPPQEPAQELKSFKATSGSPLTSQSWNAVLWEIEQRTRRDGDETFGNVTASQGLSVTGVFSVDPGENSAALGVSQTGEVTAASLAVTGSASAQSLTVGDLSITSTGLQTSNLSIADAGKPTTVSIGDSATDSSLTVHGALTVKSIGFDAGPGKISVDGGSPKLRITGTELKVQTSPNAEAAIIAEFYDGNGERGIGLGSVKRAAAGKSAAQITALSKDTIQNIEILPRGTASTQGQVIVGQNTSGEKADLTVHGTVTADDIDINGKGIGDMGKWQTGAGNQDIYFSGGNVGIGVDDPKKTLEVNGDLQATGTIIPSAGSGSDKGIAFPNNIGGGSGDSGWIRYYARAGEHCTLAIGTSNDAEDHIALMPSGNVGIGVNDPSEKLEVSGNLRTTGTIIPSVGNSSTKGIVFPSNIGGGTGDSAWLRYYARSGQHCTLELGTSDNADDHIAFMPSGNVGIGIINPSAKLHVSAGDLKITKSNSNHSWGLSLEAGSQGRARIKASTSSTSHDIELLPQGIGSGNSYQAGKILVGSPSNNQGADLAVNGKVSAKDMNITSANPVIKLDGDSGQKSTVQLREVDDYGVDLVYDGSNGADGNCFYIEGFEDGQSKGKHLQLDRDTGKLILKGDIEIHGKLRFFDENNQATIYLKENRLMFYLKKSRYGDDRKVRWDGDNNLDLGDE